MTDKFQGRCLHGIALFALAVVASCAHRGEKGEAASNEPQSFEERLLKPQGANFSDSSSSRRSSFEGKGFKSKGFATKEYRTTEASVGKRYKDKRRNFPTDAYQTNGYGTKEWHDANKQSPLGDDKARTKTYADGDKVARTKTYADADKEAPTKDYAGADRRFKSSTTKRQNYATTKAMENGLTVEDLTLSQLPAGKAAPGTVRTIEGSSRQRVSPLSLTPDSPALEKPLSVDDVRYMLNKGGR